MTEDVAAASLRNNYQQSLALSLAERRSAAELADYALLMRALEARRLLDRTLEALPSDMELQERARSRARPDRPELAVLLSYAKIALQHDLLESAVPDEPQLEPWLTGYFPPLLRERFAGDIAEAQPAARDHRARPHQRHRQPRRPGHGGAARQTRRSARRAEVAYAFLAAREVFELPALWQRIDALDGKVKGDAQIELYQATRDLVNAQTLWFLRNGAAAADLAGTIVAAPGRVSPRCGPD